MCRFYLFIYFAHIPVIDCLHSCFELAHFVIYCHPSRDTLEKGMATHSSILAWRIPWTEETGGLQSMVLHRVVHDWMTDTSRDSSEICKIQMSFYCEQVDLEVWQYPASDPGFWRASALSLYTPTLLSSKCGGFIFLNWTNCFTFSCPKRSVTQVSFKLMSL